MKSTITSQFQTSIPKAVIDCFKLSENDTLDWEIAGGKIIITARKMDFLSHQNSIKIGDGDISKDIALARTLRGDR